VFIKELVGALASPLTIVFVIGGWAAVCRMRGRKQIAAWLVTSAAAVGYLGAIAAVGDALLGPLERRYPPLRLDQALPKVRYVVVLGSGYTPRDGIPVTAALDEEGLVRIVEGIRLARRIGGVRLVVSGGSRRGGVPPSLGYAELAGELGVDSASIVVLDRPPDTNAEARAVTALLGQAPFVLVTSASHMPRAVRLMERAGAHPIPAPTGQRVDESAGGTWRRWIPASGGLRKTESALHEYLGLAAIATDSG
jgi:uncharacterized SAM-binding protein YcdF (DUF218 family)